MEMRAPPYSASISSAASPRSGLLAEMARFPLVNSTRTPRYRSLASSATRRNARKKLFWETLASLSLSAGMTLA